MTNRLVFGLVGGADAAVAAELATAVGSQLIGSIPAVGIYQVSIDNADDAALTAHLATLRADARVAFAVREYLTPLNPTGGTPVAGRAVPAGEFDIDGDGVVDDAWDESAPGGANWHLELVKAPSAWDIARGTRADSKIAIIDAGFDAAHDDLSGQVVSSSQSGSGTAQAGGTHAAGVAAASGLNQRGVTGVTWDASLYLFGLGSDLAPNLSNGSYWSVVGVVQAVVQACDAGARVINLNLGANWSDRGLWPDQPRVSTTNRAVAELAEAARDAFRPAVQYAADRQVLIIQAAGDDSHRGEANRWDLGDVDAALSGPAGLAAEFNNYLVVAACDAQGDRTPSSNTGAVVKVAAPGGSGQAGSFDAGVWSSLPGQQYGPLTGTGAAAPAVSGLAGLLLSIKPNLTANALRQAIVEGAAAGGRTIANPAGTARIPVINAAESAVRVAGSSLIRPVLRVTPGSAATLATTFQFDGRGSSVIGETVIRAVFDAGDGSAAQVVEGDVTQAVASHQYTRLGTYTVTMKLVGPGGGVLGQATQQVGVGGTPVDLNIH